MKELHSRSALKSLIWRIVGVLILGAVTYYYTHKWFTTSLITFIHHGVFLFVFYAHERIWLRILSGYEVIKPWRLALAKMFTYETLCGNIILGTITYLITGSWKQMTAITLTYIGIKHLTYIFNEFLWKRITWGENE